MRYLFFALTLLVLYLCIVRFEIVIEVPDVLQVLIYLPIIGYGIIRLSKDKSKLLYEAGWGIMYGSIVALGIAVIYLAGIIFLFSK
jgi:hypothetical protein